MIRMGPIFHLYNSSYCPYLAEIALLLNVDKVQSKLVGGRGGVRTDQHVPSYSQGNIALLYSPPPVKATEKVTEVLSGWRDEYHMP